MLEPGTHVGPFQVETSLKPGEAGFAEIYAARLASPPGGELVALKIARVPDSTRYLPDEAAALAALYNDAIRQEVALLESLHHPGIRRLRPVPVGRERFAYAARALSLPGAPWYCAMEYLAGGSLADWLASSALLPVGIALDIVEQVGRILAYIHERGIVHCDVKPGNILFPFPPEESAAPRAVLTDFGAGGIVGLLRVSAATTAYAAPELRLEAANPAPPVDVYSLSALLHRLLTGRTPNWVDRSQHPMLAMPADVPVDLADLLSAGLAPDPGVRPTVGSFAESIAQIRQRLTTTS